MSLYALAHPWVVQDVEDGVSVKLTHWDLDVHTLSILADELEELGRESGLSTLYLDFANVRVLTSVVVGKLFALQRRLRDLGVHLVLSNLNPALREIFQAVNWSADPARE
jgi:anti-anti-sigma regulatory factor